MLERSSVNFQIRLEFNVPDKESKVRYNLYFSSENQDIYSFIVEMKDYHQRLGKIGSNIRRTCGIHASLLHHSVSVLCGELQRAELFLSRVVLLVFVQL